MNKVQRDIFQALRISNICLKTLVEEDGLDPSTPIGVVSSSENGPTPVVVTVAETIAANDALLARNGSCDWAW